MIENLELSDHHRNAGDVGLGRDEVQELDHGLFRVDQALVPC